MLQLGARGRDSAYAQAVTAHPTLLDHTQTLGLPEMNSDIKGRPLPKSRAQTPALELVTGSW